MERSLTKQLFLLAGLPGSVLLFPSHLVHGVDGKKGKNLRISLAFNVFFKGCIGSKDDLTELVLE